MLARLTGESGRYWIVDETQDATIQRRARCFYGWEEHSEHRPVWVQRVLHGELFADDRGHLNTAYEVPRRPEIANSPHILQSIDRAEPYNSYFIFELADAALDQLLGRDHLASEEASAIEYALRAAVDTIHATGLIHCDVKPDNVFRVGDVWKLGDLGGAVREGTPRVALPRDTRYVRPGVQLGTPASREDDLYALEATLHLIRERARA